VKALHGDGAAARELLEKLAGAVEKARERAASAVEALREADSLLAEGCEKLPEAKLRVRVASSRARAAADMLLELAATIDSALAFVESARAAEPAESQRGGGA
jgi:hypothetical protein